MFLISLKAGGFGLNLTEADYVFLLDPWWNPASEAQAVDRAHRIGQDKHVDGLPARRRGHRSRRRSWSSRRARPASRPLFSPRRGGGGGAGRGRGGRARPRRPARAARPPAAPARRAGPGRAGGGGIRGAR